ncbi:uncharacterized protein LOC144108225 [Amblyomma americanum]
MSMRNADVGILRLLSPNWQKLLDYRVWFEAMQLSLLSAGISTGVAINMGSFNQFSDDNYLVVIGVAFGELFFGLAGAVGVFSIIGYQSRRLGLLMEDLVRPGLGLYYLSFTGAIGDVEYANVSSAALFTALLLCTLNSNYLLLESVLTPLNDEFPWLRGQRPRVAFIVCLTAFVASMPMATQSGMYVAFLLDSYVLGTLVPIVAFVEVAFVVGFYGVTRLGLDFKFATHQRLNPYIQLCLRVVAPCALSLTLLLDALGNQPDLYFESYRYPAVSKLIGWCFAAFGLLQIPLFAYAELYGAEFKFAEVCHPKPIWGPDDPEKFVKYLNILEKHGINSPAQLSPLNAAAKMSVAGGTAATTGAGDTAAGASPKPAAANGAHEAVLTAGAPTVGATAVESQPVNEDVIRRLSSTLGRTPNELRRMEAVLNRRMSTVPVTEQGMAAAASVPREAAKLEKEASTKKVSPPSTPPKLEIEHLPPEGYEVPVMGNFGPAWMPVNALTSPASYTQGAQGPMPAWGPTQALPAEFAGLEGQFASAAGANQPYAPQISVAPAGKPSVVVGQPMLPAGMLPVGLPQQASASLPPTGAVPLPGHRDDTGTMSPLKSALRSNERPISRGHIVINAPAAPTGPVGSGTFGDFARRQSTIQGPPVVSYSEFLRRPSVKLTLLEPIDSAGPEQEQQVQEQVKRAITDFRRKSVAAMRRMSAAPPQFGGGPLPPPGAMGVVPVLPRQSISGPGFQPDLISSRKSISVGALSPPGAIGVVPVLPRLSTSGPGFQPDLISARKSISAGSLPPYIVAPRRSSSAAGFNANLAAARRSISGGPVPLILSAPPGASTGLSFSPNMAAPRRSISADSFLPNLAVARRSISAGSFPPGVLGPRDSLSVGGMPPGVLGPRRSLSAGPDFRPRQSIGGGYNPYLLAPRRSISAGPFLGPDALRRSSSRGDRDTSPDSSRVTTAGKASADKDTADDDDSDDDDEDDDDDDDSSSGSTSSAASAPARST